MNPFFLKLYHRLPVACQKLVKRYFFTMSGWYRKFMGELKFFLYWPFICQNKIKNINRFEQRIYSQNGEDGIIKVIFSMIGATNKFCVEFGAGDGSECNTRYLIEKEGWDYLHMDGGTYEKTTTQIKQEFITAENINALFEKYHVPKTFDLLSIDLDYNTYWVWKALSGYSSRVLVIEYNAMFGPTESKVVTYDPNRMWDGTNYFGASLLALVKLGKSKGYTLLGCDRSGTNAFFVKDGELNDHFILKSIKDLYQPPGCGMKINGKYVGYPLSAEPFITV